MTLDCTLYFGVFSPGSLCTTFANQCLRPTHAFGFRLLEFFFGRPRLLVGCCVGACWLLRCGLLATALVLVGCCVAAFWLLRCCLLVAALLLAGCCVAACLWLRCCLLVTALLLVRYCAAAISITVAPTKWYIFFTIYCLHKVVCCFCVASFADTAITA